MTLLGNDELQKKRYGLFVLALLLLAAGGVGLFLGLHNPMIRSLGLMAVMISAYLVRASRVHNRPVSVVASGQGADFTAANGPGRLLWIVSVSLVPIVAGAWYLLHLDAVNGGQTAWPVYLFAGVAVVCAVVWGLLAA